jgi:hypothetical protein
MVEPATAAEVARSIADVLEKHDLPYAIGGAIALGFYAPPRATIDVDVNVFVSPTEGLDTLLAALEEGVFVPAEPLDRLARRAREEGQFRGTVRGLRVDVFVPAIPFYARLRDRRREVILFGRSMWILSAEDLAVLKLMFFRRKDLADVEAIMRDQGSSFDRAYVRDSIADLVGSTDERLKAFDDIQRDIDSEG